jgi:multidrug resistance efflux pump
MINPALETLKDQIASCQATIDQAQAHFDQHKHLLTEDQAWHGQAAIDAKRFQLELQKLQVKALSQ